jgi:hypothetical protein
MSDREEDDSVEIEDVAGEQDGSSLCQSRGDWSSRVSRKSRGEVLVGCKMAGLDVNIICIDMLITSG